MREGMERIRVVVADSHDEIARRIAGRMAEIIRDRGQAGEPAVLGLATGSTPIGIYRELIRLHREEGLDFSARRDVQPRRVLPDGAGQPAQLPPLHVGEPVRPRRTSTARNVHIPRGDLPRDRGRGPLPRVRARRSSRPAASTSRSSASARPGTSGSTSRARSVDSRTRLVVLDTITRRAAAADFFGTENVPSRGDHDGRRDHPRGARDRPDRDRRAQGGDRAARGRGRRRPRGRRDLPAAAPERHRATWTPRPRPS